MCRLKGGRNLPLLNLMSLRIAESHSEYRRNLGAILFETGIVYRSKVIPDLRLRLIDVFIPLPQPYYFQGNILVLLPLNFHNHDTAVG